MRLAALAAGLSVVMAARAAAQTPPRADTPSTAEFMSRYDFHLSAAALAVDDNHFSWDTHFGGDFDLVDYVRGRLSFLGDYQAVLGNEFRPFDPYEGNYTLEVASSFRVGRNEFAGALHHVSRHLGDRPKPKGIPVAWNEIDARLLRRFTIGGTTVDLEAEGGKVIEHANVDYSWIGHLDVTVRHALNPNVGVFGRGSGRTIGVISGRTIGVIADSNRARQQGGHVEGGVRLAGRDGAVELFVGAERVIDADLFDGLARNWAFAGFRIVTK